MGVYDPKEEGALLLPIASKEKEIVVSGKEYSLEFGGSSEDLGVGDSGTVIFLHGQDIKIS
jgi:hypothetical protein